MSWSTIWLALKNEDMRNRVFAVLGTILIFRFLAHIPIPLSDGETLRQILQTLFTSSDTPQLLSFIDVLSGGALANFSIMLIGLGPYINASIIMQLMTKAIPSLETLNKEGEFGRRKINQYTRILTFPLAIIQAIGMIFLVRQTASSLAGLGDIMASSGLFEWVLMVTALVGGAMLLMWMGELMTEQGIGNGISLLITVGIVSQLPQSITAIVNGMLQGDEKWVLFGQQLPLNRDGFIFAVMLLLAIILITAIVVKLNEASRNLTVHYAKRVQGNRAYGGVTTRLPIKLITAGVIPIIFALAFLSLPSFAGQLLTGASNPEWQKIGANLVEWFQPPTAETFAFYGLRAYIYPAVYFLLVFAFTFFYTGITFNAAEIAENLQKQGGFIEGVRSGKQTEIYLSKIVNRLTLFGAVSLGLLAALPVIAQAFISSSVLLEGTSTLILVAVALETLRQVESRALMVTYDRYEQPDFFYSSSPLPGVGSKSGIISRLLPRKKSKK